MPAGTQEAIELTPENSLPAIFGYEEEIRPLSSNSESKNIVTKYKGLDNSETEELFNAFIDASYSEYITTQSGIMTPFGRIYIDQVSNIEFSSQECMSPFELAGVLEQHRNVFSTFLQKHNLFVSLHRPTVGFHENYLSLTSYIDLETNAKLLTPHLVSRVVLFGSGGTGERGQFCFSPRLSLTSVEVNSAATAVKPLVIQRAEQLSEFGTRIQIASSDHLHSYESAAAMFGATAFAIRLMELDRLPKTDRNWFEFKDDLNDICSFGTGDTLNDWSNLDLFEEAVDYQRQVWTEAKKYVEELRSKGLPEFFGSTQDTNQLLQIWLERIEILEKFISDYKTNGMIDIGKLHGKIEWSKFYEVSAKYRERHNISDASSWVPMKVKAYFTQICAIGKERSSKITSHRKEMIGQSSYLHRTNDFLVPRAKTRATIIKRLSLSSAFQGSHGNWEDIQVMFHSATWFKIKIPNPFSGDDFFKDIMSSKLKNNDRRDICIDLHPSFAQALTKTIASIRKPFHF